MTAPAGEGRWLGHHSLAQSVPADFAGACFRWPWCGAIAGLAGAEADLPCRRATAFAVREGSVVKWQPPEGGAKAAGLRAARLWRQSIALA